MAIEGRVEVAQTVEDNIYDNNAKEIDPDKVKAALASLIESYFNLKDDELHSLNYQGGNPLSDFLAPPLWGATGNFDVGGPGGAISGNQGIIQSATATQLTSEDTEIMIMLSTPIADRKLSVTVFTDSTAMDSQNDIGSPVVRIVNGGQIRVAIREFSRTTQSIRLEILAFKI